MVDVVRFGWTGEMGAHAPIILATGLWLLFITAKERQVEFERPRAMSAIAVLAILLPLYAAARITQITEVEGFLMYACLIAALYSVIGPRGIKALWFPLLYIAFIFPPPETIVTMVTFPMKLWISQSAVSALGFVGYPIGGQGVTINIGQYQLLVAAACAGLNTIISLSAISLFYVYVRHRADLLYVGILAVLIIPVALFANFLRVLILILLTYHFGEATGQGFMHDFAGLFMFVIALGVMFVLDAAVHPIYQAKRKAVPTNGR